MKKSTAILASIIVLAVIAAGIYLFVGKSSANGTSNTTESIFQVNGDLNFVPAAKAVTPAVVHIKTTYSGATSAMSPYRQGDAVKMGSGSGVIISADGYIATNNHVVENSDKIEVILPDRRSFTAELVGRDPNTDLALLKVKASGLPVVKMGNSDNVQVGEWVLAVGYPFSLNTTVTAGIVSAKGRSIGIINSSEGGAQQQTSAIESFIQTDAAINPGNSGGALVNIGGELIGINTAIASLTGSYAGYAFAVPVSLVKKILDDLKEFGTVKRGILGVTFPAPSVEDQYLRQEGISPGSVKGVFVTGIQERSAAAAAGLREGDIIQSIDGIQLFSSAEFSERIARHRPGDKVKLTFSRDGKVREVTVTLKGEAASPSLADESRSMKEIYDKLGATLSPLTPGIKEQLNLRAGVLVTEVRAGGFFHQVGIPAGTIIVYINGKAVSDPQDVETALLEARNSRVQILAVAPDGSRVVFNFSLGA